MKLEIVLGEYLKKTGRSMTWLANTSGVSYGQIEKVSNGKTGITIKTLEKILDALECKLSDIIKEVD